MAQEIEMEKFVVYHISSTMMVGPLPRSGRPHTLYAKTYKTAGFARRACEKFNAQEYSDKIGPGPYGWCSTEHYRTRVVRMVERTNLISGKKYREVSNTPNYLSPSSESYWSM